jgi:hypothetical protein
MILYTTSNLHRHNDTPTKQFSFGSTDERAIWSFILSRLHLWTHGKHRNEHISFPYESTILQRHSTILQRHAWH